MQEVIPSDRTRSESPWRRVEEPAFPNSGPGTKTGAPFMRSFIAHGWETTNLNPLRSFRASPRSGRVEEPAFHSFPKTLRSLNGRRCHPENERSESKDPRLLFAHSPRPASDKEKRPQTTDPLQIISPSRRTMEDSHEYASLSNLARPASAIEQHAGLFPCFQEEKAAKSFCINVLPCSERKPAGPGQSALQYAPKRDI